MNSTKKDCHLISAINTKNSRLSFQNQYRNILQFILAFSTLLIGRVEADTDRYICHGGNISFVSDRSLQLLSEQHQEIELEFTQPLKVTKLSKILKNENISQIALSGWFKQRGYPELFEYIVIRKKRGARSYFGPGAIKSSLKHLRSRHFRSEKMTSKKIEKGISNYFKTEFIIKESATQQITTKLRVEKVRLSGSPYSVRNIAGTLYPRNLKSFNSPTLSCTKEYLLDNSFETNESVSDSTIDTEVESSISNINSRANSGWGSLCTPAKNYKGSFFPNCYYNYINYVTSWESYLYMYWAKPIKSGNITYEHDFFLDNRDGNAIWDISSTDFPGCFPVVQHIISDFPRNSRPYVDTRFNFTECEHGLVPFTIGLADFSKIQAKKWYKITIDPYRGNIDLLGSDSAILQAQQGHRDPKWCYSTWCSFGDAHKTIRPTPEERVFTIPSETAGILW